VDIFEKLKLTETDIARIEKKDAGQFDTPPDRTPALLRAVEAKAKTSAAGNICFDVTYQVAAWPQSVSNLNLGLPRVWDNGKSLVSAGGGDVVGQPLEYAEKLQNRAIIFNARLKAHGIGDDERRAFRDTDLTLGQAHAMAPSLVGRQTLAVLRVDPAGGEYVDAAGETKARNKARLSIGSFEAATDEALAKRGIERPEIPF
jgi:hypothetical protein